MLGTDALRRQRAAALSKVLFNHMNELGLSLTGELSDEFQATVHSPFAKGCQMPVIAHRLIERTVDVARGFGRVIVVDHDGLLVETKQTTKGACLRDAGLLQSHHPPFTSTPRRNSGLLESCRERVSLIAWIVKS